MNVDVDGRNVYVATGDEPLDPSLPIVVLVHGAGMNSNVWRGQSSALARNGFSVAAIDLPGHGRSEGPALRDVPSMGRWLIDLLDALEVETASLIGHSMGTLIALEAAAAASHRIVALALLGAADVMPVNPDLLAVADAGDRQAFELVTAWSLRRRADDGSSPQSGASPAQVTLSIFEEQPVAVLATDLRAVDGYHDAPAVAGTVSQPVLLVIGHDDRMTRPNAARRLSANLAQVQAVELDAGHLMMLEDPDAVGRALLGFLAQ